MIYTRVIPTLLLKGEGLVKTKNFKNPVYVGDPINAVKIFNEKEVDELILLDIEATKNGYVKFEDIEDIVSECFMPVGYGGGINNMEIAKRIISIGIEKLVINSASFDYKFIESLANTFGNQSVVISIDVKKNVFGKYILYSESGNKKHKISPVDFAKDMQNAGAGEIIIQSIDREGSMKGYDLDIIKMISDNVDIPVVASGGAGSFNHMKDAINIGNASAVTAGSMFVFKGKHNAILIHYLTKDELSKI